MSSEEACKVRVIFFGALRGLVGMKEDLISFQKSAKLATVLEAISTRYGKRFQDVFTHQTGSSPLVTIFVNGRSVSDLDDCDFQLESENEVEISLVSQMTGGS